MRALLLLTLLLTAAPPVVAQDARPGQSRPAGQEARTPAPTPRAPSGAQPFEATRPAMTFRIVEGEGAGVPRWIDASGRITTETPAAFERFQAENNLSGLTVFLDSFGGSINGGLRLGRLIRAANLTTSVGRTMEDGRYPDGRVRHVLITHSISCNSACTYVFMGGQTRRVERSIRFGVHQFSSRLDASGRPVDPNFGPEDFVYAQQTTARVAVYMAEMGVDLSLLEIIKTVPYGRPLRFLTREEIERTRLAVVQALPREGAPMVAWGRTTRADEPMLYRRLTGEGPGGARLDTEVALRCGSNGEQIPVTIRQQLIELGVRPEPVTWERVRFATGQRVATWNRPAQTRMTMGARGNTQWLYIALPRDLVRQAVDSGRFEVRISGTDRGDDNQTIDLSEAFQPEARRFVEACETLWRTIASAGGAQDWGQMR